MNTRKTMPCPPTVSVEQREAVKEAQIELAKVHAKLRAIKHEHLDDALEKLQAALAHLDAITWRDVTNDVVVVDGPKRKTRKRK